jgi:outer membrane protein TolC
VESSLNNLCVLAGALPGELDDLAARAPVPFAADLPDVVPADLLRRRPDVRAAERRFAAKTAAIGVAKGDLYPKFSINGEFGFSTTYGDKFFDQGAQSYFIGPGFSWDIFTAGKIRNNVRAKEAAARAALADYRNTVLTAYAECETAFASWRGALRTLDALESAVEAAAKSVELAENLYRNGLTDFQNLLDMQKQLTEYEDSYAQTQGSVASYLVSIHKALGGSVAAPAAAEPAPAAEAEAPAAEAADAPAKPADAPAPAAEDAAAAEAEPQSGLPSEPEQP